MINGWIATAIFAAFALFLNLGMKKYYGKESNPSLTLPSTPTVPSGSKGEGINKDKAPQGALNFFESILEIFLQQIDAVTKDRKKTLQFLPVVGGIFLFIVTSNWLGLFPGISTLGVYRGGEFIPLLRSADTDLNLTLCMAVFAVVLSHVVGVATIGFFKYANKFIKLGDLYHAFKSLNPVKIFVGLIEFMVGFIEIISEVAKVVSLSLRLFGNIFAGEVLMAILASLIAYLVPLPFMGLELLVGVIQALVFSMLTLVYLTVATTAVHGHAEIAGVEMEED